MKNIYIKGSHDSYFIPTVDFNADTGVCEISGESYLEETIKFYNPLFEWLNEYFTVLKKEITFKIKLTYFNTSSSKCIVDMLNMLKAYENSGGKVVINWYYDDNEEDIEEELDEVEDFILETGLNINIIPFSKANKAD